MQKKQKKRIFLSNNAKLCAKPPYND